MSLGAAIWLVSGRLCRRVVVVGEEEEEEAAAAAERHLLPVGW